jgi:hypothetical protein
MRTRTPAVGDIIMSSRFVRGYFEDWETCTGIVTVGESGKWYSSHRVDPQLSSDRVRVVAKASKANVPITLDEGKTWTCDYQLVEFEVNYSANDISRRLATFVVEEVDNSAEYRVVARRLYADGSYNPNGEQIQFYMSGDFLGIIPDVDVVGRIERTLA